MIRNRESHWARKPLYTVETCFQDSHVFNTFQWMVGPTALHISPHCVTAKSFPGNSVFPNTMAANLGYLSLHPRLWCSLSQMSIATCCVQCTTLPSWATSQKMRRHIFMNYIILSHTHMSFLSWPKPPLNAARHLLWMLFCFHVWIALIPERQVLWSWNRWILPLKMFSNYMYNTVTLQYLMMVPGTYLSMYSMLHPKMFKCMIGCLNEIHGITSGLSPSIYFLQLST